MQLLSLSHRSSPYLSVPRSFFLSLPPSQFPCLFLYLPIFLPSVLRQSLTDTSEPSHSTEGPQHQQPGLQRPPVHSGSLLASGLFTFKPILARLPEVGRPQPRPPARLERKQARRFHRDRRPSLSFFIHRSSMLKTGHEPARSV